MVSDREHHVAAYDDVTALARRIASFVDSSLRDGIDVVTVTRPQVGTAVERLLLARGTDLDRARGDGRFVTADAEESLGRFMVDGRPDAHLFADLLASLAPGDGPLGAFGEMVSLLWERGEVAAALELEQLWNTAILERPVRLLCAYPGEVLAGASLDDVARLCALHDHVSVVGAHPAAGAVRSDRSEALSSVLLPVSAAVGTVRRFTRETLGAWGLDDLVDDVALITSELATNAVTHAASPFRTSLVRTDDVVRVSVEDGSRVWPQRQEAMPEDQDGRGMAIIATLAERSGCDSTPRGKVAWAELAL